jgi:signal transduction histidine kinase
VARLHDLAFWRALKGRITDLDPGVRAPAQGEALTADQRRVAWQSRPLPDGATLVSFVDVTDTRRLEGAVRDRESALAAAERLKREFVSSVSYELRTPLTTILGYAELLERTEQGLSARARDWVAAVRAAATDLARSVEDVLAFAELDAGEMTLKLGQADIATLLGTAAARARDRAASAGVDLEVASQDDPGVVVADADSLGRVLDHLIDHALNQTPSGGRVILSARRAFGEVCLEVSDTGRGIPFHVQARIFDRFSGEDGAGAGLGLALVKALVELHGGWVAVESAPGAGATFSCHLPEGGQLDPDPFAA